MFSSKCEVFALQVAHAWVAELFSKWGNKCTSKKLEHFCDLNWKLWRHKHWIIMSLGFDSMFKQFYSILGKPSTTPIYTTPYLPYTTKSQQFCQSNTRIWRKNYNERTKRWKTCRLKTAAWKNKSRSLRCGLTKVKRTSMTLNSMAAVSA